MSVPWARGLAEIQGLSSPVFVLPLRTLRPEPIAPSQGRKNPEGRRLMPASVVLQESLNRIQTLFPLLHLQRWQPDRAPLFEPCSSRCWRGHGLCHDTGVS